jgi:hypothetical protein
VKPAAKRSVKDKEGWLQRRRRVALEIWQNPRSIETHLRRVLLDVWRARGGGFYGIGYVIAFVYFEISIFAGEFSESDSVSGFALGQILEYVLRFSVLSFFNVFRALLWPLALLGWSGGWGFAVLAGGYLGFEYGLRPYVERVFPELAQQREEKRAKKSRKAEHKARRRSGRRGSKRSGKKDRPGE